MHKQKMHPSYNSQRKFLWKTKKCFARGRRTISLTCLQKVAAQKCLKFSSKDVSRGTFSSFLLDLLRWFLGHGKGGGELNIRAYLVVKELLNSLPLIKSELKIIKLKLALEFGRRNLVLRTDAMWRGARLWLLDPNKRVFWTSFVYG